MKKSFLISFALLCALVQDAWAQTTYNYYECSWKNNQVVRTQLTASGSIDDISTDKYSSGGGLIGSGYDYFVATKDVTIPNGLTVSGDCKLILLDGVTVTVEGNGIEVLNDATLTIYGQAGNSGKLIVLPEHSDNAGIGSKEGHSPGNIRIHGGYVEAHGGAYAAGIGGGNGNSGANLDIYGGTVKAYGGKQAAGIGGGCKSGYVGYLVVYGGDVYAEGGEWGAGIGLGYKKEITSTNGGVTIQSGTVTAKGGDYGAGIGGGYLFDGVPVTINGGTVTATGGEKAAGIGGGRRGNGNTVNINGGSTVTATGGPYGAGIGGGADGSGATVGITGGTVTATGGMDAAGIGSGEQAGQFPDGGSLTVTGGTVYAYGTGWGAGIGGGEDANGATVEIKGGTVTAKAGTDAAAKNGCAIGAEDGDGHRGSLTIGDKMMVHAGADSNSSSLFPYETRVPACYFRPYAKIESCNHEGSVWSINSNDEGGQHTLHCFYCLDRTSGTHTFVNNVCTVCNAGIATYNVSLNLPSENGATIYAGYSAESFTVASGKTFALPEPPKAKEPAGMAFAGWMVIDPADIHSLQTYVTDGNETLLAANTAYTVTAHAHLFARYTYVDISLADNADNSTALLENNGEVVHSVTLTGRTLYKDGNWNTLCLPFDHEINSDSPLYDNYNRVDVRELSSTSFENGELTLNFTQVTNEYGEGELKAGTPYLIKWPKDMYYDSNKDEIDLHEDDLKFQNVTIKNNLSDATTDYIDFIGTFSPTSIYEAANEKTYLYLGEGNNLYYPTTENFTVNACRAYFQLENDLTASPTPSQGGENISVRAFKLNFGDEATGIAHAEANSSFFTPHSSFSEGWFTLDGRRLAGKPTQKGIYIRSNSARLQGKNNSKVIIIK